MKFLGILKDQKDSHSAQEIIASILELSGKKEGLQGQIEKLDEKFIVLKEQELAGEAINASKVKEVMEELLNAKGSAEACDRALTKLRAKLLLRLGLDRASSIKQLKADLQKLRDQESAFREIHARSVARTNVALEKIGGRNALMNIGHVFENDAKRVYVEEVEALRREFEVVAEPSIRAQIDQNVVEQGQLQSKVFDENDVDTLINQAKTKGELS